MGKVGSGGKTKKAASELELRGRGRERGGGSSGEKILAPRPVRAERIGERHARHAELNRESSKPDRINGESLCSNRE